MIYFPSAPRPAAVDAHLPFAGRLREGRLPPRTAKASAATGFGTRAPIQSSLASPGAAPERP